MLIVASQRGQLPQQIRAASFCRSRARSRSACCSVSTVGRLDQHHARHLDQPGGDAQPVLTRPGHDHGPVQVQPERRGGLQAEVGSTRPPRSTHRPATVRPSGPWPGWGCPPRTLRRSSVGAPQPCPAATPGCGAPPRPASGGRAAAARRCWLRKESPTIIECMFEIVKPERDSADTPANSGQILTDPG